MLQVGDDVCCVIILCVHCVVRRNSTPQTNQATAPHKQICHSLPLVTSQLQPWKLWKEGVGLQKVWPVHRTQCRSRGRQIPANRLQKLPCCMFRRRGVSRRSPHQASRRSRRRGYLGPHPSGAPQCIDLRLHLAFRREFLPELVEVVQADRKLGLPQQRRFRESSMQRKETRRESHSRSSPLTPGGTPLASPPVRCPLTPGLSSSES